MFKQFIQQLAHWFLSVLPQDTTNLSRGRYQLLLRWLMPNGGTLILLLLYIGISRTWGAPATNPPLLTSATEINFSGYLADDNGNPLDGPHDITVAIYSESTGGTRLWGPESHFNVPVTEGNWTVGIGSVLAGGVPTTLWSGNRYLQITVEGEVLSPRQLIRSVPIAGLALTVPDGSITPNKLAPNILLKLLDTKSCHTCSELSEVVQGWSAVKGSSLQDAISITVATNGNPIIVHMTSRHSVPSATILWCAIGVYQGGNLIIRAHLDGADGLIDLGCSGSYIFDSLPAGTYTFTAMGFSATEQLITWRAQRQIAVYESPLP